MTQPTNEHDDLVAPLEYTTTVGRAIAHLESIGFTWDACVEAEEETRGGTGAGEGVLMGDSIRASVKKARKKGTNSLTDLLKEPSKAESKQLDERLRAFAQESGAKDLSALSKFLWDDLREGTRDDETEPHYWARFLDAYSSVETSERGMLYPRIGANATRAYEALAWLKIASPILCWPMTMRIALEAVPKASRLTLDLGEDVAQRISAGYVKSPQEYAERFYKRACESVGADARLVGRFLSVLSPTPSSPARDYWRGRAEGAMTLLSTRGKTSKETGDRLEELVCSLMKMCEPDLEITERNLRKEDEELDVVVANHIKDPFWVSLQSALLFIECKNWSSPVGAGELRVFFEKVRERRSLCRVGFLIAPKGFAKSLKGLLRPRQSEGLTIFLLTMDDLRELVEGQLLFSEWVPKIGVQKLLKMS